ncbi:hypothetical protein Tco_1267876, partial [Tanacetum coccineum]
MAEESRSNSVVDDLIELSGKTNPNEYLKLFVTSQDCRSAWFIARIGPRSQPSQGMKYEQRKSGAKAWLLCNTSSTVQEEEIVEKQNIMDTQAIDDQAHLANYDSDNEIENDDLGYHSEEYFDDAYEDDENNHSNRNVVKRGIT